MKILLAVLLLLPSFAFAQTTHTVAAKETLYSLARKYNVHPRELAAYNNIPVETSLTLGQVIKIPSKTTMAPLPPAAAPKTEEVVKKEEPKQPVVKEKVVDTKPPVAKNEGSNPIYHKVQKKETLYHISKLYPNVTIADIKKWNRLTSDALSEGSELIVGYSKTKNETVKQQTPEKQADVNPKPIIKDTPVEKKQEDKVVTEPVKTPVIKNEDIKSVTGKNFNGGAFKGLYTEQTATKKSTEEQKGTAGIFKSTSGWEDGKYYCLTNNAPAGTIVKVTNSANQKIVYAKVLDVIPDLKQNTGIILRISNSAAEELGATTDNFDCTINY